MPIKFQYNKTALNTLQKQLKMRQKALPTLQNKESALRLEVRKAKDKSEKLLRDLEEAERRYDYLAPLWNEFEPGLVSIVDIDLVTVKVAGVKCPELKSIRYEISPFNTFIKPAWYIDAWPSSRNCPGSGSSPRFTRRSAASWISRGRRPRRR